LSSTLVVAEIGIVLLSLWFWVRKCDCPALKVVAHQGSYLRVEKHVTPDTIMT
jgi:hypothetical protein